MKKILQGVAAFRQNVRDDYRVTFARLGLEQRPDCLFITCSDSRVVPNLFTCTQPGDLFFVRNIGNLVPACGPGGYSTGDEAEAAAIEFAVQQLQVRDIVVCGHSNCGAMRTLLDGTETPGSGVAPSPNLARWLRHALPALEKLDKGQALDTTLLRQDALSQLNVLEQMAHVESYPAVAGRRQAGLLGIHGWWFDVANAEVCAFDPKLGRFVAIDEAESDRLPARLSR